MHQLYYELYYVSTLAGMIDLGMKLFITTFRSLKKKQLGCHAWKRLIDLLLR